MIRNLPVELRAYDAPTDRAGDVVFSGTELSSSGKLFLEFNGVLPYHNRDVSSGLLYTRLPHFTFSVPEGTTVAAMSRGVVQYVEQNTNRPPGDMEVRIAPHRCSDYQMVYDHLKNVVVSVGEVLEAGQKIGESTGPQLEADVGMKDTAYCPNDFFDPEVAPSLEEKLSRLMRDWESYKGDPSLYDEAAMYKPGCATKTGSF